MRGLLGNTYRDVVATLGEPEKAVHWTYETPKVVDRDRYYALTPAAVLWYQRVVVTINVPGTVMAATPRLRSDLQRLEGRKVEQAIDSLGQPCRVGIVATPRSDQELAEWLDRPAAKLLRYPREEIEVEADGKVIGNTYRKDNGSAPHVDRYGKSVTDVVQELGLPESIECLIETREHSAAEVAAWLSKPLAKRLYYSELVLQADAQNVVTSFSANE